MQNRLSSLLSKVCLLFVVLPGFAGVVGAEPDTTWPNKPVRIIVTFAVGGPTDVLTRMLAQRMSEKLGQPFIVENRPGAGGNVGSDIVAKAAADGYLLLVSNPSPFSINPYLYKKMRFVPERDLVGIVLIAQVPNVLMVNASLPVKSVSELIAYIKQRPGKISYSSGGNGTTGHLSSELFKSMAGLDIEHVPYGGSAPALLDLVAGRVQMTIDNLTTYIGKIKDGSIRLLAVGSPKRFAGTPDIPTMDEAGVLGFSSTAWYALAAPAKTPPEVLERINIEANKIIRSPDFIARANAIAAEAMGSTVEETNAFFRDEAVKWKKVIEASGVSVD